jgi:hypothetical protein
LLLLPEEEEKVVLVNNTIQGSDYPWGNTDGVGMFPPAGEG